MNKIIKLLKKFFLLPDKSLARLETFKVLADSVFEGNAIVSRMNKDRQDIE